MSSQVISYRFSSDEVLVLREKALPGESDNQTAQRLMREFLGLSTALSTEMSKASTPSLSERIEAVEDKLSSFTGNVNESFSRLQERIQALEAKAIAPPPTRQAENEPDSPRTVDNDVDSVDTVLTAKELAQRLKVHPATLTKNRAKESFTDWTQGRDPEGKAWQYLPEVERYKPLRSRSQSI